MQNLRSRSGEDCLFDYVQGSMLQAIQFVLNQDNLVLLVETPLYLHRGLVLPIVTPCSCMQHSNRHARQQSQLYGDSTEALQ